MHEELKHIGDEANLNIINKKVIAVFIVLISLLALEKNSDQIFEGLLQRFESSGFIIDVNNGGAGGVFGKEGSVINASKSDFENVIYSSKTP